MTRAATTTTTASTSATSKSSASPRATCQMQQCRHGAATGAAAPAATAPSPWITRIVATFRAIPCVCGAARSTAHGRANCCGGRPCTFSTDGYGTLEQALSVDAQSRTAVGAADDDEALQAFKDGTQDGRKRIG